MMFALSTSTFITVHIVVGLLAVFSGAIVVHGMIKAKRLEGWTRFFLVMTGATTMTGLLFRNVSFGSLHVIGVVSLVTLAIATFARYGYHLEGVWRGTYAASAVLALYLNVLVGIVQAFEKLPFLASLTPTQSAPPFLITQVIVTLIFIVLGGIATLKFHPHPGRFS